MGNLKNHLHVFVFPHRLQFSVLYTGMSGVIIMKGPGLRPWSVCLLLVQAVNYASAWWAEISADLISWETINHLTYL